MTNCTCIDCMYGGNVGNESGGVAPPSNEKGDVGMSKMDDIGFVQYYAWAKFSAKGSWHVVRVVKDNDGPPGRIATQVVDTTGKHYEVTDCIEISDPIKNPDGGCAL